MTVAERTANELAAQIRAYWLERGYRPDVSVEPMPCPRELAESHSWGTLWTIRSDMLGGLPRGWAGERRVAGVAS